MSSWWVGKSREELSAEAEERTFSVTREVNVALHDIELGWARRMAISQRVGPQLTALACRNGAKSERKVRSRRGSRVLWT